MRAMCGGFVFLKHADRWEQSSGRRRALQILIKEERGTWKQQLLSEHCAKVLLLLISSDSQMRLVTLRFMKSFYDFFDFWILNQYNGQVFLHTFWSSKTHFCHVFNIYVLFYLIWSAKLEEKYTKSQFAPCWFKQNQFSF